MEKLIYFDHKFHLASEPKLGTRAHTHTDNELMHTFANTHTHTHTTKGDCGKCLMISNSKIFCCSPVAAMRVREREGE